jgi:hypothetical protein
MSTLPCPSRTFASLTLALLTTGCSMDYGLVSDTESSAKDFTDRGTEVDPEDHDTGLATEPDAPDAIDTDTPMDRPEAICGVSPAVVRPVHDTALWKGSGSDPNGYAIIDYDWALVSAPAGSSVGLYDSGRDDVVFQADLAGVYTAQLVVTNEVGVESLPCEVDLEAIPGQALWIEMFWALSGDDMDLHLVAPGGTLGSDSDCYWDNCVPEMGGLDWGIAGDLRDDVFLDLDDIDEKGPENINIEDPMDGLYSVVVHDWTESVQDAPNRVTVNVYLDGDRVWSDTRTITGEDSVTEFAVIDVTNGTVEDGAAGG